MTQKRARIGVSANDEVPRVEGTAGGRIVPVRTVSPCVIIVRMSLGQFIDRVNARLRRDNSFNEHRSPPSVSRTDSTAIRIRLESGSGRSHVTTGSLSIDTPSNRSDLLNETQTERSRPSLAIASSIFLRFTGSAKRIVCSLISDRIYLYRRIIASAILQ